MDEPLPFLKWSLLGGAVYFVGVALAHFFQFKVPMLYIYYDVPSTVYQDKIISFAMLGWAFFYVAGYSSVKRGSLRSVRYIVLAGIGAIGMLTYMNLFTDFSKLGARPETLGMYWVQTGVLSVFLIWIAVLYKWAKRISDYQAYSAR